MELEIFIHNPATLVLTSVILLFGFVCTIVDAGETVGSGGFTGPGGPGGVGGPVPGGPGGVGGPVPINSDCRFWLNISPDDIQRRQRKWRKRHKVFYYWNTQNKECLPCTRCQSSGMRSVRPCQYFRDSVCAVKPESYQQSGYPSYRQNKQNMVRGDGRLIYKGFTAEPLQFNDIWGVTKLHQVETGTESASRRLARVGADKPVDKYYSGSRADYGKPSFYSKDPKNSVQSYNKRPVVDLIREMLSRNTSSSSARGVGHPAYPPSSNQINKSNNPSFQDPFYSPGQQQSDQFYVSDDDVYGVDGVAAKTATKAGIEGAGMNKMAAGIKQEQKASNNKSKAEELSKAKRKDMLSGKVSKTFASHDYYTNDDSANLEDDTGNKPQLKTLLYANQFDGKQPIKNGRDLHKKTTGSTDLNNKSSSSDNLQGPSAQGLYTSFQYDQTSQDIDDYVDYDSDEDVEDEYYDYSQQYKQDDDFGIKHKKMDATTTRSPGDEAFDELRDMIQGRSPQDGLGTLKLTLLLSSLLTGSLLAILIGIIIRNKIRAQRFKILNNSELGEQRTTPLHSITGTSGSNGVLNSLTGTSGSNGVFNEAVNSTKGCSEEVEVDTTSLEEVTIPLAVARSLKNIRKNAEKGESMRQDSVESGATISTVHSGATIHSCIVDEKGKTQLKS